MFKFQFYIIHYLRINEQNEKVVSFCFLTITLCSCLLHVCKLKKKSHCDKTDDNDVKKTCYHIYKTNKLPLYETFSKILFRYPYSVYKHSIILFFQLWIIECAARGMNALTQKLRVIMIARNVFVSTIYNLPRPTAGVKVNKTTVLKGKRYGYFLKSTSTS